jgi:DNA polymerase (family X)
MMNPILTSRGVSDAIVRMDKHAVALVLEEIAALLEGSGDNRFRARAFQAAARAVEKLDTELTTLVAQGTLRDVRGIGPATARVVEELVVTGEATYHNELRERQPSGLRELLRVPGLGPGRIARLHAELGIADLDSLEAAARDGRIAGLRGFGPRTQQQIVNGISFARTAGGRRRYADAEEAALRLAGYVAALDGVATALVAGAVRRCVEVVDAISIVAVTEAAPQAISAALTRTPGIRWHGQDAAAGRTADAVGSFADGLAVSIHVTRQETAGATLLLATGSAAHVAAVQAVAAQGGMALAAGGLRDGAALIHTPDETSLYRALRLPYIPPELRETGEEVELARRGGLPRLVELQDLRGCFHCHTTYSDGKATLGEMAEGAIALGWRYLGIADHSRTAGYAGGLSAAKLLRQSAEIDAWNRRRGSELRLFAGVEADIMHDGQLDFAAQGEANVLAGLDYVVASVHSRFRMPRAALTARIQRAVSDPLMTMLGHATGRLLLTRDGYDVDIEAVIESAARAGALIEINADPRRLDLSWQHWDSARRLGVRTAINPDAHSVAGMRNVRYGVNIARKAQLTATDVVNTWPVDDVVAFLAERKHHGSG